MLTAIGPWRLRSSGAHCDPELVKRIGEILCDCETLGEEDRRDTLAKSIGEEEETKEKKEEKQTALMKSSNPHLAGGEIININN